MRTEMLTRDEMPAEMLRKQHRAGLVAEYTKLRQEARDLVDEIEEDTSNEDVRRIERKHDKLVARIEALRAEILQTDFAEQERQPPTNSNIDLPGDASPTIRSVADALYFRMGGGVGKEPTVGRELMSRSAIELGAMLIEANGGRVDRSSRSRMADQVMATRAGGSLTVSDLPSLLQSTGNRILLENYEYAGSPLRQLARERSSQDFRALSMLRVSEAPALELVLEHGEVKTGPLSESKQSFSVKTYAKIVSVTRNALINDDLNALGSMAAGMGRAAAEAEALQLVGLLTANSNAGITMDDSLPVFHTDHGNIAGSLADVDTTKLAAGRLAMRSQTGLDGVSLINAAPAFLLVGKDQELKAEQALSAIYAATTNNANPFSGALQLLVEPRLGDVWYLFSSPSVLSVLEIAFLSNARGPQIATREGFERLGLEWRVTLDVGVAVSDWRGAYKGK
jgi:hypothetical protein